MIDRRALTDRLRRLARAAPSAFREDPVFRYAVLSAAAALLMLPHQPGRRATTVPRPPAPPTPAALSAGYAAPAATAPAATPATNPIAPGRALNSAVVRPDRREEPDRFGSVGAPTSETKRPPA